MEGRLPNLFIIGAMKSGTSSLHEYLGEHPDIFMSSLKEPQYFSNKKNYGENREEYRALFKEAGNAKYAGESSTNYTKLPVYPDVARRLFEFNPEGKLIYLMREPFERALSHYWHSFSRGRDSRPISQALQTEDYLAFSHYARQLQPYISLFGRGALYLCTTEEMKENAQQLCSKIFSWLDIDACFTPAAMHNRFNVTPEAVPIIPDKAFKMRMLSWLQNNRIVQRWIPRTLQRLRMKARESYHRIDRSDEDYQKEIERARTLLKPRLDQWNEELEKLTGDSFACWRETD
jgi:hypothetical protein